MNQTPAAKQTASATRQPINKVAFVRAAHEVLQSLNEDRSDLQTMLKLLKEERKLLEQREHDQLETLTQQKNQLSGQLEQRNTVRQNQLARYIDIDDASSWRTAIEQLEQNTGLPLVGLWNDVERLLHECRDLLQINEKIVSNMQNSVNQFLNTLRGQIGTGQTYEASGKAKTYIDNNKITSA